MGFSPYPGRGQGMLRLTRLAARSNTGICVLQPSRRCQQPVPIRAPARLKQPARMSSTGCRSGNDAAIVLSCADGGDGSVASTEPKRRRYRTATPLQIHPPDDKGFEVLFLAQISNVGGEPRKKQKGRKQGPSAVQNRCRIGDEGTGQFFGFAPFAVPCFQPRITRMRRMKSLINAINAAFLP